MIAARFTSSSRSAISSLVASRSLSWSAPLSAASRVNSFAATSRMADQQVVVEVSPAEQQAGQVADAEQAAFSLLQLRQQQQQLRDSRAENTLSALRKAAQAQADARAASTSPTSA